jgi:hypothetical protein
MSRDYSPRFTTGTGQQVLFFSQLLYHLISHFTMTSNEEKKEPRNEKVLHNYHDYANEVEKVKDLHHQQMEELPQSAMNRGERNFPVMLHYMLDELVKDGFDDIVSWQPHGRCFLVHKQQLFVEQVLSL